MLKDTGRQDQRLAYNITQNSGNWLISSPVCQFVFSVSQEEASWIVEIIQTSLLSFQINKTSPFLQKAISPLLSVDASSFKHFSKPLFVRIVPQTLVLCSNKVSAIEMLL